MNKSGGIAFIPARCGSKSIPLKNIKLICGKPLIYWNIAALEATKSISKIVIATDCNQIADCVKEMNFSKTEIYFRDEVNAQDTSSTESVMLEYLNKNTYKGDTPFFLVQATNPFTTTADFGNALAALTNSKADSLITCARNKHFFWSEGGQALNYDYKNRPRRQEFDGVLAENGAFYINSVKNILTHKNRLSGKILIHEMPDYTLTEIDEPADWIIVENLMKRYTIPTPKIPNIKLFATDVDGVLTDAGMYYTETGDELKKFNTRDGKGLELMRNKGVKTAIITSEDTQIVTRRAKKLKVDYLFQGKTNGGKLAVIKDICQQEGINLSEVAYIGDDVNCFEALSAVGLAACPKDAVKKIKDIPNILLLDKKGGEGAVRSFIEYIFDKSEL